MSLKTFPVLWKEERTVVKGKKGGNFPKAENKKIYQIRSIETCLIS